MQLRKQFFPFFGGQKRFLFASRHIASSEWSHMTKIPSTCDMWIWRTMMLPFRPYRIYTSQRVDGDLQAHIWWPRDHFSIFFLSPWGLNKSTDIPSKYRQIAFLQRARAKRASFYLLSSQFDQLCQWLVFWTFQSLFASAKCFVS